MSACNKKEVPPELQLTTAPLEITAGPASAAVASSDAGIESCAKAVLARAPGELLQATLKSETAGRVWEFKVKQADGKLFDIECSDSTGTIVETEVRVTTAADPAFAALAALARIDEAAAKVKALEAKPGSVERVEFELEPDGKASCEFDIKTTDDDYRVEIDATAAKRSNHRRNCWKSAASDRCFAVPRKPPGHSGGFLVSGDWARTADLRAHPWLLIAPWQSHDSMAYMGRLNQSPTDTTKTSRSDS